MSVSGHYKNSIMPSVVIISSSVRSDRKSDRVATYLQGYMRDHSLAEAEIADLSAFDFPVFTERLSHQENPAPGAVALATMIKNSDGVIIVTPEYNGGYPASLKNVTDLLAAEWHRKPVAFATVSDGDFGGTQVITSIQFVLWKMKAMTVPSVFTVANVDKTFDKKGLPVDSATTERRASRFIADLLWHIEACQRMR